MERSEIWGRSASLNAAPGLRCASSGLQRQQIKKAERRQARNPTVRTCGRGAHPAGRARLSAFHHDARCSDRTPQLSSSYALPGTWSERAIPMVRKIVHLATHSRVTSGRYRRSSDSDKCDRRPYYGVAEGAFPFLCCILLVGLGVIRIYRLCSGPPNEHSNNSGNDRGYAIFAVGALIIGWALGIYGTILGLPPYTI